LGIIDAESWKESHFTPKRIAEILRVCYDLGTSDFFSDAPLEVMLMKIQL